MFNKIKKNFSNKDQAAIASTGSKLRSNPSGVPATASGLRDARDDAPSVSTQPPMSAATATSNAAPSIANNSAPGPSVVPPSYQDQPETDYDLGPSQLYTFIENKQWESAIERSRTTPSEVRTWISRREPDDPNRIRWRLLPLHATCVFRAPLGLIESLIAAYPPGPSLTDDQGMLPIHLACRNGASRGVVTTLLNAYPKSINVRDKKGRTPLNLVENSNSQNKESVIEAMQAFRIALESGSGALPLPITGTRSSGGAAGSGSLASGSVAGTAVAGKTVAPIGEREVDYENRTILFRLILKKDWDGVQARLGLFPDEASTWIVTKGFNGNLRFLPLHKACVLGPPPAIVQGLIRAFPDGVLRADQDGWLPLHCACFYSATPGTIDALLKAEPKAAQKKDDDGRLPLHYACLKSAPESVVSQLLSAHVRAALVKDNDGRMPLHHACSKAASDAVVESLVRLGPKAAQSKDNNGRLPLHLACKRGVTKQSLGVLLQVYARGAAAKDDQEKLPVHHACQSGACSPAAVLALLDAHPESIHARTAFGLTPHDEACQPKQGVNMDPIIEVLDRFKAEQERLGTGPGARGAGGGADAARVRELEDRVAGLTNRVDMLQDALGDIAHAATRMKMELASKKGGDARSELLTFCDALARLNPGGDNNVGVVSLGMG